MPRIVTALLVASSFFCPSGRADTVAPDAETDTLLARVFSYTARTGLHIEGFSSEVYARHRLRTRRRGVIMRYLPGMFRLEHGENEYLGESLSHYRFRPPGGLDRKTVAAYSTMPYISAGEDLWTGRYTLSIYEPNLFTDRILSPLNRLNRKYYRYQAGADYVISGRRYVTVVVTPAIHNTQLVKGFFDVDAASGAVRLFSFDFMYDWALLRASGEMGEEGRATLLPRRIHIGSRTRLLGNRVDETFEATARYRFDSPGGGDSARSRYDLTEQCRLRTDRSQAIRERAAFDSLRPYPLLPAEAAIYQHHDSLHSARTDTARAKRRLWLSPKAEDFLFDSHDFYLGRQTALRLPPLLTPAMVQWSDSRGVSLQTRFTLSYRFFDRFGLNFRPRVGYSFKQRQVYWQSPLILSIMPWLDGRVSVEAGGGDRMYNSAQADEVLKHFVGSANYDSIVNAFNRYDFDYYRDTHIKAELSLQPVVGLRLSAGIRYHYRRLIGWNEAADKGGLFRSLFSIAPRVHIDYTPGLYFYRDGKRPVPLHSSWPTFMIDYERGLGESGRSTHYERFETDIRYRLPLHALRSFYFRLGAGFYTRRGRNCFLDYDFFRQSYLPETWDDEMAGRFQLLDTHWYNESRYYVRSTASYESPMLLFSRLKFLTRVVQKERLYANLLTVRRLGCYSEWGYGVATPLIDVAAFVAIAGQGQTGFGAKVVLSL